MDRRRFLTALATLAAALPLRSVPGAASDGDIPALRTALSQFILLRPTPLIPALPLVRTDGVDDRLPSSSGKALVVNFWATWCPPCVEEMPSLDRLERDLGGTRFRTLAISVDRDPAAIAPFFRQHGIGALAPYVDLDGRVGHFDARNANDAPFALYGLPITYVVDRSGRARGYVTGPVDWQSSDAQRFLRAFIDCV